MTNFVEINMDKRLALAESILEYTFINKSLGLEALMMAGGGYGQPGVVQYSGSLHFVGKNDRLAILGDRLLAAHLSEGWYPTGEPKGSETDLRNDLTTNDRLLARGLAFGLDECIMLNAGTRRDGISERIMGTTMEALIGAVHLDVGGGGKGYDAVRKVMETLGFFEHEMLRAEEEVVDESLMDGGPVQKIE
ncbi:ribonuclease III [Byssothecium circinans]|uniref:Ribonuclease III n=1 Tax=Byssothecium circinans TaxID=147558 RepID=A0A6A5TDF4_9PLEO|nr:ribonuclease III [Byssothecium circinans]